MTIEDELAIRSRLRLIDFRKARAEVANQAIIPYGSDIWNFVENELRLSYNFFYNYFIADDFTEDDICYVICHNVNGSRGVSLFYYGFDNRALSAQFYYDKREMLDELLDRLTRILI